MPRRRASSRLTVWLFAALLLAKGAVPFLAAAAAQLHGTGVADVCPIYGVALPAAPTIDPHAARHHPAAPGGDPATAHGAAGSDGGGGPVRHDAGGGDHCVLTALATFAADTSVAIPAPPTQSTRAHSVASLEVRPVADAAARWAALVGHGPPLRS